MFLKFVYFYLGYTRILTQFICSQESNGTKCWSFGFPSTALCKALPSPTSPAVFVLGGGLQQIIQDVKKKRTHKQHMWLSYRSSHSRNDRYYGPRTANQKPKFDPPRNDLPQYSGPIGIPGQRDQLSWCNQFVRIKFSQLGNIPSMLAKYKEVEECLKSTAFVILINRDKYI